MFALNSCTRIARRQRSDNVPRTNHTQQKQDGTWYIRRHAASRLEYVLCTAKCALRKKKGVTLPHSASLNRESAKFGRLSMCVT